MLSEKRAKGGTLTHHCKLRFLGFALRPASHSAGILDDEDFSKYVLKQSRQVMIRPIVARTALTH
jgi:hypothetical protein